MCTPEEMKEWADSSMQEWNARKDGDALATPLRERKKENLKLSQKELSNF